MKITDKERGANVRRNLRRWWKPLLVMMAGWILLTLAVCLGAITYAHSHHFSQRRIQMLAEGCGAIMCLVLIVAWLVVLVMADRKKSE
jgi:O-antigen/teichoic acid export membrane protein